MAERAQWKSKVGFILAASGSAIGLGNVVFFSANAYKFGAGAFYIPYLIALLLIGIPIMILEFGLGHHTRKAFPQSLAEAAGKTGEFFGWWAILNACFIAMYYITIIGWVLGMWIGSFDELWKDALPVPAFDKAAGEMPVPKAYFYNMLTTWDSVGYVAIIWVLNAVIVWKGIRSIEVAVKFFVPLMWAFMIILIVRGLTLPNGLQGLYLLFTPNFEVMIDKEVWPQVWQGAFSQIFFTLSLGFGIMTAYASYLPKESDQVNNAVMTSCLNCSFEFVAGIAIFSLLFVYAVVPEASGISMMFFLVPQGIAALPAGAKAFGILFFTLLLFAGLSSSISLVETFVSSLADKFGTSRKKLILMVTAAGALGSAFFALPVIVDKGLNATGTLGFTLLDLIDHWAFKYGLLFAGLVECVLIAWVFGARRIVDSINESSKIPLGPWFVYFVRFVIPPILIVVIGSSIWFEIREMWFGENPGIYGAAYTYAFREDWRWWLGLVPYAAFAFWFLGAIAGAWLLTRAAGKEESAGA